MRAAVLSAGGDRNLSVVELPDPEPGPGECLVRVRGGRPQNYRGPADVEGGYGHGKNRGA